ncbi:MAG: PTS glucose transporter subunit IIA [Lachnospiraceae bacterium]|nr:PTS glucose transporter subunit IIA [Lachnospiraceae bacterium]
MSGQTGSTGQKMTKRIQIASPLSGKVLKLEELHDDAFASGALGAGVGILPDKGEVYAPADGVISTLFPTLHAIGMETDEGVELLIHIGLDTVQLEGKGFEAMIGQGDRVRKGQLLVRFDADYIKAQGFLTETPVIVVNTDDYLEIVESERGSVAAGDGLLTIVQ